MATLLRLMVVLWCVSMTGCSKLMFFPMKPWVQNPARIGLGYEDIILIHPDGQRLHGWWLPAVGAPRGTVYYLHGNAQNISTHIMNVNWLPDAGYNVFLLDYSGYGLSEGKARLDHAQADIALGLEWLRRSTRLDGRPLILFGQSLGASMSVGVLAQSSQQGAVQCAVFEAAFTGYRDITSDVMKRSWLLWPMRPLVIPFMPARAQDPLNNIGAIEAPKLIMHSKEDEIIPFSHGEKLYDAAAAPKQFQPLLGRHIEAMRDPDVQQRVLKFFSQSCALPAPSLPGGTKLPSQEKREPERGIPVAPVSPGPAGGSVTF